MPGVGVDDDLVDLIDLEQRIENPAEQRLAAEFTEVLALDPLAVSLHGQQVDNARLVLAHGVCRLGYKYLSFSAWERTRCSWFPLNEPVYWHMRYWTISHACPMNTFSLHARRQSSKILVAM